DGQKRGGFALSDARTSYWRASEAPFLSWLAAVVALDEGREGGEEEAERLEHAMRETLKKTASSIFDAHTALSEFDPRKQERIAKARRRLHGELWPKPKPTSKTTQAPEANP
ncbi:MAG: hypothetical protein L6Q76_18995, partial [Polyangiaceae bacterium]|nr:hypothetical protein [Polyangiaceae bacterium]